MLELYEPLELVSIETLHSQDDKSYYKVKTNIQLRSEDGVQIDIELKDEEEPTIELYGGSNTLTNKELQTLALVALHIKHLNIAPPS